MIHSSYEDCYAPSAKMDEWAWESEWMMGGEKDVPDLQVRLPLHTRPHDCLCIPDHRACQPHWVRLPLHTRPQGVQSPRGQVKIPKKDCVLRPHIDIQVRWSLLCYFADLYYNNIWGDPPRRCVLCVVCCVLRVVCCVPCCSSLAPLQAWTCRSHRHRFRRRPRFA